MVSQRTLEAVAAPSPMPGGIEEWPLPNHCQSQLIGIEGEVGFLGIGDPDSARTGALQKIPMVYHSLDEMEYVRSHMEPELEQRLEAKGFVVLFWADTGWVNIFCRQPATHPDEFKHTKVFVGATDNDEFAVVKGLGIQAVPLEWSDVLTSLRTGMVDTVPTVPFFALAGQYDLVARHMLDLPWVPLIGATVITKRAWDAIPPQYHEAFRRAAADAGKEMQARGRQESLGVAGTLPGHRFSKSAGRLDGRIR